MRHKTSTSGGSVPIITGNVPKYLRAIGTAKKVSFPPQERQMANSPIPDQSKDFVKSGMVLITDPRSDKYLNMAQKRQNDSSKDRK
jgi:hypothetical protein